MEPSCGYCDDFQNRNYGHLDYVAIEETTGIHLLGCPRCGALDEDNSHDDPSRVGVEAAMERWGYRAS